MVAIASMGSAWDSVPADRFGRAPFFVLVEKDVIQGVVANDDAAGVSGVGGKVVQTLLRQGVTAVVAPKYGPKAEDALKAAGISAWTGTGTTVRELARAFDEGTLLCAVRGNNGHE